MHQHDKNYDYMEIEIAPLLYSRFIKYDKLDQLIRKQILEYKDNELIVFIDMYTMVLPLFRSTYNFRNELDITSCVINMAIHYRNYFKRYGKYAHIFIIYSPTMGRSNIKYIPSYNYRNINTMLNNKAIYDAVNNNTNLIGLITPYIDDIYFKLGSSEVSVIAYDLISQLYARGFQKKVVMVSASHIAFQLINAIPDILFIYKKRNKNNDDLSVVVTPENAIHLAVMESKNHDISNLGSLPSTWLAPFFTLCGLPQRSIKMMFRYNKAIEILSKLENAYSTITPDSLFRAISEDEDIKKDPRLLENIMFRYKCIDLIFQLAEYRTLPESRERSFMRQVSDYGQLITINNEYLKNNPINLQLL